MTSRAAVVARARDAGDLGWNGREWRRWDGRRWRSAINSLQPDLLHTEDSPETWPTFGQERLERALALAVERQVTNYGASVVYAGPHGTVVSYNKRVNHAVHALLTLITGIWVLVWLAVSFRDREDRVRLEIDSWGHVWAERLRSR